MISDYPTIFIAGAGRTGTTMISRILDKSEQACLYFQETHAYPLLWTRSGKARLPENVRTPDDFAAFIEKKYPQINIGWRHEKYQPLLNELAEEIRTRKFYPDSASHFLDFLLTTQQSKRPGVIMGEKTPAHIYYYQEINKYFKSPKFIITVRDPRATALSEYVKKNIVHLKLAPFNLLTFIVRWNTVYRLYEKMLKELGPQQVLLVKYEDLVSDPEPVIRNICRFSGIDFDSGMLELGVFNSSFGDKFQTGKNFNTENIDRWRSELDTKILSVVENNCGNLMERFGYTKISSGEQDLSLKDKLKMYGGYAFLAMNPAWFHNINRNKMYYS